MPWPNDDIATVSGSATWSGDPATINLDVGSLEPDAGDLLLLYVNFDPAPVVSGFTQIVSGFQPGGANEQLSLFYKVADGTETIVGVTLSDDGANTAGVMLALVRAKPVLPGPANYLDATPSTATGATAADLTPSGPRANTLLTMVLTGNTSAVSSSSNADDIFVANQSGGTFADHMTLYARDVHDGGAAGATYTSGANLFGSISLLVSLAPSGPEVWVVGDGYD